MILKDIDSKRVRFTKERQEHIESEHPEMLGVIGEIKNTLKAPDKIVKSNTDPNVELFYRFYKATCVGDKYLCVVVREKDDRFILTAYFTDTIKKGEILWQKK